MNIVYGGSFNPPTKAHKYIIDSLYENFNPENLIVVPVGNVYNKQDLESEENRYEMLKLLDNRITISKLEFNNKYLGTYELLNTLKKTYDDLYYVIGADNLENLSNWINADKLMTDYKFIVFNRDKKNLKEIINSKYEKYSKNFLICDMDVDISATDFRKTKDKNLLTDDVYKFIKKNKMYGVI